MMYHNTVKFRTLIVVFLLVLFLGQGQASDWADIPCSNHGDCTFLGASFECFNGEFCIKSTVAGCLRNKNDDGPSRVCNSADSEEMIQRGLCREPSSDEMEIRIYAYDWDTSKFQAWILQILFSELLDIPVSIETGNPNVDFNFYSPQEVGQSQGVRYNEFSNLERALRHARIFGDCRLAERKVPAGYEACAHFSPEVRFPIIEEEDLAVNENSDETYRVRIAEPLEPTGAIGEQGLYIPKFTAERDPTLLSYLGMMGEKNRQKLADAFPRPIRWGDYCSTYSPSRCTIAETAATRAPLDKAEGRHFFVPGLYDGFFAKTDKNDCAENPSTCTGHIADYPCGLYSPVSNQIFHLDLALEGDGYFNTFGYYLSELPEIWHAANSTKSNLLMYWTEPTVLSREYVGTDAEFTRVAFPVPSQDCLDSRRNAHIDKCVVFWGESYGDPDAVCDYPPFQLQKVVAASLYDILVDGVPEVIRSPSYAILKAYSLPQGELLKLFEGLAGYDDPRLAVCKWVGDNMDMLERFVPPTYPRVIEDKDQNALQYAILLLGILSLFMTLWTSRKVYVNRKRNAIRFAQVEFLAVVLVGSLLTALGAMIGGFSQNNAICAAESWLVYLGYSLSLVPQIVKIAAINRIRSGSRSFRRFQINLRNLYGAVALVSLFVVAYLSAWTVMDTPKSSVRYILTDTKNLNGETIVLASYSCGSETMVWEYVAFTWNGLLLLAALVLTIQTRDVIRSFSESKTLGLLIYTNFVFFIFRGLTYYLEELLDRSQVLSYRSMIYALDVIAGHFAYFWTKLILVDDERDARLNSLGGFHASARFMATSKRFVPEMTNISEITMPKDVQDDNQSLGLKKAGDGVNKMLSGSLKIDGETVETSAVSSSVTTGTPNKRIRELEAIVVCLQAETKFLRKIIEDSKPRTLATVGADPPSPKGSTRRLSSEHNSIDSPNVNLLSIATRIPSPMASSSTSDAERQPSSMPPLASYNSILSESARESQFSQSDNEAEVNETVVRNHDATPSVSTRRPLMIPSGLPPGQTSHVTLESVSIELDSTEEQELDC